jgi:hypothetical protein
MKSNKCTFVFEDNVKYIYIYIYIADDFLCLLCSILCILVSGEEKKVQNITM